MMLLEPTAAQSLEPNLTQTEPESAKAIPWSQVSNNFPTMDENASLTINV